MMPNSSGCFGIVNVYVPEEYYNCTHAQQNIIAKNVQFSLLRRVLLHTHKYARRMKSTREQQKSSKFYMLHMEQGEI